MRIRSRVLEATTENTTCTYKTFLAATSVAIVSIFLLLSWFMNRNIRSVEVSFSLTFVE